MAGAPLPISLHDIERFLSPDPFLLIVMNLTRRYLPSMTHGVSAGRRNRKNGKQKQ
jgi:hypothetical protein